MNEKLTPFLDVKVTIHIGKNNVVREIPLQLSLESQTTTHYHSIVWTIFKSFGKNDNDLLTKAIKFFLSVDNSIYSSFFKNKELEII